MKDQFMKWWLPILIMVILAPFTPWLDKGIENYFYNKDVGFVSNEFIAFVYNYLILPADIVFAFALVLYLLSFFKKNWKTWRKPSLALILAFAIGAGFVAHALLKDHWGRPRPKQVIEYGGTQEFRPFYKPNFFHQPYPSKSFPCGHCLSGFYFFSLAFAGQRLGKKWLFWSGIFLAVSLGGILSYTRMAQGGHFLSDTLFSALIMWYSALICDWFLWPEKEGERGQTWNHGSLKD